MAALVPPRRVCQAEIVGLALVADRGSDHPVVRDRDVDQFRLPAMGTLEGQTVTRHACVFPSFEERKRAQNRPGPSRTCPLAYSRGGLAEAENELGVV